MNRTLLVCLVLLAGNARAGINSWTLNGPEGDYTTSVAIHPTQPDTMFAQGYGGLYRTTDAGANWTRVSRTAATIDGILFDPTNADRIYVAADFLYRSTDGGVTFTTAGRPSQDHIQRFAIARDGTLYAAGQQSRLYRSTDQGANWQPVTVPWSHVSNFYGIVTIATDPNTDGTIYIGHEPTGLYRSDDGGTTWAPQAGVSPGDAFAIGEINSIAVQPGNSNRLLVGSGRAYFSSSNRGASWTRHFSFFERVTWVGFDPSAPTNAVALRSNGDIFRSTDSGDTFPFEPSLSLDRSTSRAAFAPSRAGRLLLATGDGPFLSDDGGASFAPRVSGTRGGRPSGFATSSDGTLYAGFQVGPSGVFRHGTSGWAPVNNDAMRATAQAPIWISSLATAASNPDVIYATTNFSELLLSTDRGTSWSLPGYVNVNSVPRKIAVDPANAGVIYATTQNDGVWKTIDGGVNWNKVWNGLPNYTHAIGIDPANHETLYVSSHDPVAAIYKSTDGGANWTQTGSHRNGMISGFTFHPVDTRIIYAYSGFDVLKTTNGGQSWSQMDFGAAFGVNPRAQAVLIDPLYPTTMFIVGTQGSAFGVLRSVDGGNFWELIPYAPPGEIAFLDAAALDPLRPNVLYVGESNRGIAEYEVATDLSVVIEGFEDGPVAADSEVNWLVMVSNEGPWSSSPAELRVTLPSWVGHVSAPNCTAAGTVLTCTVSALRSGFPRLIPIRSAIAETPASGQIVARVTGHEFDPVSTNNVATVDLASTRQAPLEVALLTDTQAIPRGDSMSFVAQISNIGPSRARDVRLELAMPTYTITNVDALPNQCTHTATTLSCALGTLQVSSPVSVRVTATLNSFGANAITGAVTRTGDDPEATVPVHAIFQGQPVTDVQLQIEDTPDPVVTGTTLTYAVIVQNAGPDRTPVTVTLQTPGVTMSSVLTGAGTCTLGAGGASAICELATIANGANVRISVALTAPLPGTMSMSGAVTFTGRDTAPANNNVNATTTVNAPPTQPPRRGGGGGSFDLAWLMFFGGFAILRARRKREPHGLSAGREPLQLDALQPRGRERAAPARGFTRPVA